MPVLSEVSKDALLTQIWSICTTLTEEAMAAATAKAKEAGFDINRGLVPLAESFINLSSARMILEDAIEKQKLVQLPITLQKELLGVLETISKSLQGLIAGVDEVVNLTNSIEALNACVWRYGLHNLSDQVLGYQKKLNQLKNQELQINKGIMQLESAQSIAEKATLAAADLEQKKSAVDAFLEQVKQSGAASGMLLDQIKDAQAQTSAISSTIQQYEKQSSEVASSIKTASHELSSLDGSIRKFYGEVDEYRRKISDTSDDASKLITNTEATFKKISEDTTAKVESAIQSAQASANALGDEVNAKLNAAVAEAGDTISKLETETDHKLSAFQDSVQERLNTAIAQTNTLSTKLVADTEQKLDVLTEELAKRSDETISANQKKTERLIDELAKLKEQIRQQIEQATGFTLFGAFQARQNEIGKSKNIWAYAIGILVLVSAGVTVWIAHEAQSYSAHSFAFWIKLSLTVPLGFAITFCTVQYSRERRLEEEYAFKSSISVSLNPYRDLVHSILEKDGQVDQSKYTDFVIGSVTNVFTSPTDRVFENDKKPSLTKKTFKEAAEIIGTAVKAAK